jgi:hypothetical protein
VVDCGEIRLRACAKASIGTQKANTSAAAETAQHLTPPEPHPGMMVFFDRNRGNFKPSPRRRLAPRP